NPPLGPRARPAPDFAAAPFVALNEAPKLARATALCLAHPGGPHGSSPPNKRLKLAGGDRFKKRSVVPWRARTVRPTPLRRWAGRPQLKRDPLGSERSVWGSPGFAAHKPQLP